MSFAPGTRQRRPARSPAILEPLESRLLLAAAAAQWTVMVYLDGDNDLEGNVIDGFLQMAAAGSTANVNIVAQLDRIPGYDSRYGNWTDARRGLVAKGGSPSAGWGTRLGEVDMGSANTLADFIAWAAANYPAQNYALILNDHGGGVIDGVSFDDTSTTAMTLADVGAALDQAAVPIQLLGYDACQMSGIEAADQVVGRVAVMVGSEQTIPIDGWPYDTVLADLDKNSSWSAAQFAADIVSRYGQFYTDSNMLSAVDVGKVPAARDALSAFVNAVMDESTTADYTELQSLYNNTPSFTDDYYRDLGAFLSGVAADAKLTADLRPAAQTALNAYQATVLANEANPGTGGTGMSVYFQAPQTAPDATYNATDLKFAADGQWDDFLQWWQSGPEPVGMAFYQNALDARPTWSYQGQWAWGTAGGGPVDQGSPDPTSGHTGSRFIGYNLAGEYPANLAATAWLTTAAIDCTDRVGVTLTFYRWLGVESSRYDHAYVQVSNDKANWTTVWQNPDSDIADSAWMRQTLDISAVADGQPTVYVRWGMGPTDYSDNYCGWNIDDVTLMGTQVIRPLLTQVAPLPGARALHDFQISYADLAAASDLDANGAAGPVSFRIEAITNGSLTLNGAPVQPGGTLLSAGDSLVWRPAGEASGLVSAFTVRANAGGVVSASPVQVQVQVTPNLTVIGQFGGSGRSNVKLTAEDADGTSTVFSLTGPGYGELAVGDDQQWYLCFTGTTLKSVAKITTLPSGGPADDGTIALAGIFAGGGLRSLTATTTHLAGDLEFVGGTTKLVLAGVAGGRVSIDGGPAATISFAGVRDASLWSAVTLKSLAAYEWLNTDGVADMISAPAITKLTIAGNLEADVNLSGRATDIGAATIGGWLRNASIRAAGNLGKLTFGGLMDCDVFAGVAGGDLGLPTHLATLSNPAAKIKSLTVLGLPGQPGADAVIDADIAAGALGKIKLKNVRTDNGDTPFGLAGRTLSSLKLVLANGATYSWPKTWLANPGDFRVNLPLAPV